MAISSVVNRIAYQGDGTSAVFSFPYRFHSQSDLSVFVYNSSVALGTITPMYLNGAGATGFTISATANASGVYPNGGSVVFNSTPNAQSVVTIFRSSAITNAFTVGQNGAIPSSGLNNEIDYLTMIAQRQQDLATRSLRLPDGFYGTMDMALPPILQAEQTIIVNSTRTGWAVGPTSGQIASAQSSAVAAAASEAAASASATAANSAAVSAGNSAFNANSAAVSIQNAVSLIGSTAFWGAEAQSSALSATNQAILAGSSSLSASNQAVLAGSGAVSAGAQAALAASAAVSAQNGAANIAVIQASGDLIVGSGSGSAARLPLGGQNQILMVHGSSSQGATWRRPPIPKVTILNTSAGTSFSLTPQASYLKIKLVGGGGSGGSVAANGNDGAASIFGTSLLIPALVGGGGFGAGNAGAPAAGGSASGGDINLTGNGGGAGSNGASAPAGNGGASVFGGAGMGANPGVAVGNAGSQGSGGGGSCSSNVSRAGGGAGGYVEKLFVPTASSYIYTVGDGGAAVVSGGAKGGVGLIVVEEYFI